MTRKFEKKTTKELSNTMKSKLLRKIRELKSLNTFRAKIDKTYKDYTIADND